MMKPSFSKMVVMAAVLVAVTCAAVPASAQVSRMRASVPFAFSAGDVTLPAGQYKVEVNAAMRVAHFYPVNATQTYSVLLTPSPKDFTPRIFTFPCASSGRSPQLLSG